jgi:hypothetical protein
MREEDGCAGADGCTGLCARLAAQDDTACEIEPKTRPAHFSIVQASVNIRVQHWVNMGLLEERSSLGDAVGDLVGDDV